VYQAPMLKLLDMYMAMITPPPNRNAANTANIRMP
jgi:hypothetical protein